MRDPELKTGRKNSRKKVRKTLNRIEQSEHHITGIEAFIELFFNERLQIRFKTVRRPTNLMIETGKILTLALIAVVLSTSVAAQEETGSRSVDPGLIPGDFFYPVESFVEKLEVSIAGFVGGEDFKAKAMANNAHEKLSEAEILAEKNRTEKAAEMTERYAKEMNQSGEIAERNDNRNLSGHLNNISQKNIEKMEKVKEKVPGKAGEKIEEAINRSKARGRPSGAQQDQAENPGKEKTPSKSTGKNPDSPDQPPGNKTPEKDERAGENSNKSQTLLKEEKESLENSSNYSDTRFDKSEDAGESDQDKNSERPSSGSFRSSSMKSTIEKKKKRMQTLKVTT